MWARISRFFRSIFGAILGLGENPRLLLEQSIRDLRDKLPEMNTGIAKARAGVIRLENRSRELETQVRGSQAKVKACLLAGDEALAGRLAVQLKSLQDAFAHNEEQVRAARQGYEALLKLKERYRVEMERKTEEAMTAIRQSEAAKWKQELAGVFETFEVASVDGTHDEMIARVRSEAAVAEGKLAMAVESVEYRSAVLEEAAREIEGRELLQQFKLELGLTSEGEGARKTIGAIPTAAEPVVVIDSAEGSPGRTRIAVGGR
jgi:phage shock protein A